MFEDFVAFLERASRAQALCIVLEDIHWSDPSSLDLLRFVGRHLSRQSLLMVATIRDDGLTVGTPLYDRLANLVRESGAERLIVQPLEEAGVTDLVVERYALPQADVARLVGVLVELTEGNALYITELLRSLEEEGTLRHDVTGWRLGELARVQIPPVLREVIDGRFQRLSDDARSALLVASVIGHEVPLDLWGSVCKLDDPQLLDIADEAIEARILKMGVRSIDSCSITH